MVSEGLPVQEIIQGTTIGVITGHTWSLDYGSCEVKLPAAFFLPALFLFTQLRLQMALNYPCSFGGR